MLPIMAGELRRVEIFADLTEAELEWLASRAAPMQAAPGDLLITDGEPADQMMILLEGEVHLRRTQLGADAPVVELRAPRVTGLLPFSRMTHYNGTGRAMTAVRIAAIPRSDFPVLLQRLPQLESRFIAALTDRVREAAQREDQHARLLELGKLAAGLAHELGNPAAALGHASDALRGEIGRLTAACALLSGRPEGARRLAELEQVAPHALPPRDAMARSDAEEQLGSALMALGVSSAWKVAPELVDAGLPESALLRVLRELPPDAREPVLEWTTSRLATTRLLAQVADAVERIRSIVGAVKLYSHMDRAPSIADADLRQGIRSTLVLLGHAHRSKQIRLVDELPDDLPCVPGYPGELNQVWTNLLDNAIDALPNHGTLRLTAHASAELVTLQIEDNGPGIPPEIRERIWEPFFSTKPAGHGTGLGLDIVKMIVERRHGGAIRVESVPGRTVFTVELPRHRATAA